MYKQLTSEQRYTISVLLQNRTKQKEIAKAINVSPSTVSRELRRNSGVRGCYNCETAQANAVQAKRRKPGNRAQYKYAVYEKTQKRENAKYAKKINIRPRKKLEFKTPHECFYEQIK